LFEHSYKLGAKSTAELCEIRMRQRKLKLEAERGTKGSRESWAFSEQPR
jgi:hypothetical protein